MAQPSAAPAKTRPAWWRSIGPALITACVVFGPGSLLVSANIGAEYGYDLLWVLIVTCVLMGTYLTMAARIGVVGEATPCTLVAQRLGRPAAAVIGINLFLICTTFQFANNLAVAAAVDAVIPKIGTHVVLFVLNTLVIIFIFSATRVYQVLERAMKIMVAVILCCFVVNLVLTGPQLSAVLGGLVPNLPDKLSLGLPEKVDGSIRDPMILVASLLGTTFSVGGAFYLGNLVRNKGWTIREYINSIGDSIAGVCVLTCVSAVIMMTTATVIFGKPATDIGTLAQSLQPLLGPTAHLIFCIGLLAVAMNPFLINAMIGGSILADGLGKPSKLDDPWPRRFTVGVLVAGMAVAMLILHTPVKKINAIIFGQALTVLGNPLMAVTLLWLANRKDIMGKHRNGIVTNTLGGLGLVVVLLMAVRVALRIVLQFT